MKSPALAVGARTIREYLEAWVADLEGRLGFCDQEVKHCRRAVEELLAVAPWSSVEDLRPALGDGVAAARRNAQRLAPVLDWINSQIDEDRPGSRKTAKNKLYRVRAFGTYLQTAAGFAVNPFAGVTLRRIRRSGRRGPVPFTWEEVRRLVSVAHDQEAHCERAARWGPLRSTFYLFLAYTGLRYSEAKRQKWDDVDLDRKILYLTKDKSDRGDAIALPDECVEALRQWKQWSQGASCWRQGAAFTRAKAGHVFPKVPSPGSLVRDMKRAGVPTKRDGRPGQWHRFRKALASELAKVEANPNVVHKAMRHTDPEITMNLYTEMALEDQRAALAKLARLNGYLEKGACTPGDRRYTAPATSMMRPSTIQPDHSERPLVRGVSIDVATRSPSRNGGRSLQSGSDRTPSEARINPGVHAGVDSGKWRQGDSTPCPHPEPDGVPNLGALIDAHNRFLRLVERLSCPTGGRMSQETRAAVLLRADGSHARVWLPSASDEIQVAAITELVGGSWAHLRPTPDTLMFIATGAKAQGRPVNQAATELAACGTIHGDAVLTGCSDDGEVVGLTAAQLGRYAPVGSVPLDPYSGRFGELRTPALDVTA